jgi:DNA primase
MASIIETIKARVDVVDEIGLVVALQKSGKALKGLCPFHGERTPSFYVFPEGQNWHCFGCHEYGDIFTFVEKQQGLDFREALVYLAEKAGVALEDAGHDSEQERQASALRERLRKMNEDAQLWFQQVLLRSKDATEARAYVQSRGISSESVLSFGLGYAPQQWDALIRYLLSRGYAEHELVNGGLAREREESIGKSGGIYDYFRHRLIFPIRDARGRVIGFGGRALGDGQPKYLNSPQTPVFEKNSVLYALDMAKDAIKSAKQVIIVEGYVDAVIAHQYGTRQTVACIGSAITEKHIQQLKKLTRQITLALDPDAAGENATEHGIQEALKGLDRTVVPVPLPAAGPPSRGKGRRNEPRSIIRLEEQVDAEINVLRLPAGEDPDEVIRNNIATWSYAVAHPLPLIDYYFEVRIAGLNLREAHDQAEASKRLLPVIGTITDRVKRDAYLRKLASLINSDERSLHAELQRVLRGQKTPGVIAEFTDGGKKSGSDGGAEANGREKKEAVEQRERAGGQGEEEGKKTTDIDKGKRNKIQWEDYLIGLLLLNPGLSPHVCGIITDGDFVGADTRELYHILYSMYQRGSSSLHEPVEQLAPSALLATIARAKACVESRFPTEGAGQVKDAVQCATRLKRKRLVQLNTELQYVLHDAERAGDMTTVQQLMRQLLETQRQLRTIDAATRLQG